MEKSYVKKTDEELVKISQSGDSRATDELCSRYASFVRYRVRGFFLIGGETDDLVQEGMMGLFRAIEDYSEKEGKSFKNFAYMCVERRIIDAVKKSTSKKNFPLNSSVSLAITDFMGGVSPRLDEAMIWEDENKEIRQKTSGVLSDFEFKIFTMYMDGMTLSEICEATGKPIKSVDNAIQRSKKKLQKLLKK